MPVFAVARSESYTQVSIPPASGSTVYLPEVTLSFPDNPIFVSPATVEKLPASVVKTAHDIVREVQTETFREGQEPVSYRGLVAARKAFESRGNDEAVRLVDTLLTDLLFAQSNAFPTMESRTLCREAQSALCTRFGVFLNISETGFNLGPRAAVVPEVAVVKGRDGTSHQIILLDSMDRSGLCGQFEPPHAIFINKNYAQDMPGKNSLSAVIVNELAHSYLTAHGYYGWTNRSTSLRGFSSDLRYASSTTVALCDAMRERGFATPCELHELFSDCWSTVQSPSFDRSRLLFGALQHIAHRDALQTLGKPVESHPYDLTYEIFRRFVESDLASHSSSNAFSETLARMTESEKRLIRIDDSLAKNPNPARETQLLVDQMQARSDKDSALINGVAQISEILGDEGLARQRQTYKEFGAILLGFIHRQPGWKE